MGNLLEATVLGAILLVALESTLAAVSASSNFFGHQHHLTEATRVGQALMEDLMLAYDTDPDLSAGAHAAQFDDRAERVAGGLYAANWTITPDSPFPRIRTILVEMSWLENGVSRTAQFTTFRN